MCIVNREHICTVCFNHHIKLEKTVLWRIKSLQFWVPTTYMQRCSDAAQKIVSFVAALRVYALWIQFVSTTMQIWKFCEREEPCIWSNQYIPPNKRWSIYMLQPTWGYRVCFSNHHAKLQVWSCIWQINKFHEKKKERSNLYMLEPTRGRHSALYKAPAYIIRESRSSLFITK